MVKGTVKDPSGAVIPGATVTIYNPVTGFERTASTDASGSFTFTNVPFNPYHLTVTATGFAPHVQDVDLNSAVPVNLNITMELAGGKTTVTVSTEASDLIEVDPIAHTDVDRALFDKLPLESQSSSTQFPWYTFHAGNRRGFERSLPWIGRSRGKLLFRRRPAHHGPAKQDLLESDFPLTRAVIGSDSRALRRRNLGTRPAW